MFDACGAHRSAAGWVEGEVHDGVGPLLWVFDGEDEAGVLVRTVVEDDFFWAALVCGDDGDSGGLGFHDDLSEGVGGGGEGEDVGGCVEGGEFLFVFESEEVGTLGFEFGLHFFAVGAIADDDELGGLSFCFDSLFD